MTLPRRSFLALASGLLIPAEPVVERAYSFVGGWGNAMGSVFVNGVWRAWVREDRGADRLVEWVDGERMTHDVHGFGSIDIYFGHIHRFGCVWTRDECVKLPTKQPIDWSAGRLSL